MKKRTNLGLLAVLLLALPAVTIYALMEQNLLKQKDPGGMAVSYLVNAPTFSYDGIPGTMNITGVYKARTLVPTWLINAVFKCEHSGYGDRSGEEVKQTVTNHSANLIVQEGKVISTIIDGVWDEINQEPVCRNHIMEFDVEDKDIIIDKAFEFLTRCPTYRWDGIENTLKLEDFVLLDTFPLQYRVIISFNSSHTGYGNRTGTDTAQVITHHTAQLLLEENKIVSATLDNIWDIISQRTLQKTESSGLIRELAVEYIIQNHLFIRNISTPAHWVKDFKRHETRLEEGEVTGYTCVQYHSGDWTVQLGYQATIDPTYDVQVEYQSESWFTWKGQIESNNNITELDFEAV